MNINIRKNHIFTYRCFAMYKRNLQITIIPDLSSFGQNTIITSGISTDTAVHFFAPAKRFVGIHSATHQSQDLPCCTKMNKFSRGKAQKFHPIWSEHFPNFRSGRMKFRAKFPFRFFIIKLFKGGILRKRVKKVPIQRQTHGIIYIFVIIFCCRNQRIQGRQHIR